MNVVDLTFLTNLGDDKQVLKYLKEEKPEWVDEYKLWRKETVCDDDNSGSHYKPKDYPHEPPCAEEIKPHEKKATMRRKTLRRYNPRLRKAYKDTPHTYLMNWFTGLKVDFKELQDFYKKVDVLGKKFGSKGRKWDRKTSTLIYLLPDEKTAINFQNEVRMLIDTYKTITNADDKIEEYKKTQPKQMAASFKRRAASGWVVVEGLLSDLVVGIIAARSATDAKASLEENLYDTIWEAFDIGNPGVEAFFGIEDEEFRNIKEKEAVVEKYFDYWLPQVKFREVAKIDSDDSLLDFAEQLDHEGVRISDFAAMEIEIDLGGPVEIAPSGWY